MEHVHCADSICSQCKCILCVAAEHIDEKSFIKIPKSDDVQSTVEIRYLQFAESNEVIYRSIIVIVMAATLDSRLDF